MVAVADPAAGGRTRDWRVGRADPQSDTGEGSARRWAGRGRGRQWMGECGALYAAHGVGGPVDYRGGSAAASGCHSGGGAKCEDSCRKTRSAQRCARNGGSTDRATVPTRSTGGGIGTGNNLSWESRCQSRLADRRDRPDRRCGSLRSAVSQARAARRCRRKGRGRRSWGDRRSWHQGQTRSTSDARRYEWAARWRAAGAIRAQPAAWRSGVSLESGGGIGNGDVRLAA